MKLTKEQIIEREKMIYDESLKKRQDPVWNIAQDRKMRWTEFMLSFPVRQEIVDWEKEMTASNGTSVVRMFQSTVGWVVALLICRYGEAEYHWPDDGFSDDDVTRAKEWANGKSPEGCVLVLS